MIFCEDCRVRKKWPHSPGFPYVGTENGKCEICKKPSFCHAVPSVVLIPEGQRTFEQKQIYKMMQQGFQERAESLVITYLSGKLNHKLTEEIQKIVVKNGSETDWYTTYFLRLAVQKGYQIEEESKRNKRE